MEVRLTAITQIKDDDIIAKFVNEMRDIYSLWSIALDKINSTDILLSLATAGKSADIVMQSALKLAKLCDKRVITNFDDIARQAGLSEHGSYTGDYDKFLNKIISVANNIPCEDTVIFLENKYLKNKNSYRNDYTAFNAQKSLLSMLKKVKGTPLADRIESIKDINIPLSYESY